MKNSRPTIKDIAKELNVSVTTVSFVLNGKGKERKISDKVISKILRYIKKIDFKPNSLAQSLRSGKSKMLVLMVEDISNPFFSKIARNLEDIVYKLGYKLIFCSNENDDQKSIELIQLFRERHVDGYIIVPSAGIRDSIQELIEDNIPVVLFDRYFDDLECNYVIVDNKEAVFNAMKHLVENNYKWIGFITLNTRQTQMRDRLLGYKEAMKFYGLQEFILEIPFDNSHVEKNKTTIHSFLSSNPNLDALFFSTNYLTQNGLEVIQENFSNKKADLGIITFDDNDLFKIYTPSISAVAQPLHAIVDSLKKIMLNLLREEPTPNMPCQIMIKTELHVRQSSSAKVEPLKKS